MVLLVRLQRRLFPEPAHRRFHDHDRSGLLQHQPGRCGGHLRDHDLYLVRYGKPDVIVSKISVDSVVEAAKKALYTGHIGDGKIFVYNVTRVVTIRTGEEDFAALQDVE